MRRAKLITALAAVVLTTLAACGGGDGGVAMHYDEAFADRLREIRDQELTVPFAELVPGEWTTAHVILGPHTEAWVEREVGTTLPDSDYGYDTDGNIVVFLRGTDVVELVGTTERLLGEGRFSADAVLTGEDGTISIDDARTRQ